MTCALGNARRASRSTSGNQLAKGSTLSSQMKCVKWGLRLGASSLDFLYWDRHHGALLRCLMKNMRRIGSELWRCQYIILSWFRGQIFFFQFNAIFAHLLDHSSNLSLCNVIHAVKVKMDFRHHSYDTAGVQGTSTERSRNSSNNENGPRWIQIYPHNVNNEL